MNISCRHVQREIIKIFPGYISTPPTLLYSIGTKLQKATGDQMVETVQQYESPLKLKCTGFLIDTLANANMWTHTFIHRVTKISLYFFPQF